jgi:hypothetical protein
MKRFFREIFLTKCFVMKMTAKVPVVGLTEFIYDKRTIEKHDSGGQIR